MTKFEQIGIEYQMEAIDKVEAIRSFNHSCKICCSKGAFVKCDRCAISQVHYQVLACFDDLEAFKAKSFQNKTKARS